VPTRIFHHVISTDRIRSFKPDPRAYQLGFDVLGLRKEAILFVAFAGWDVAGSKWFGTRFIGTTGKTLSVNNWA
jgi:2-haloacid dehalogenase